MNVVSDKKEGLYPIRHTNTLIAYAKKRKKRRGTELNT